MSPSEHLQQLIRASCPYPMVCGSAISTPTSGLVHPTPSVCAKVFNRSACREFYKKLTDGPRQGPVQCPNGFSAWRCGTPTTPFIVTGLIPFPRLGGGQEAENARKHPQSKAAQGDVEHWMAQTEGFLAQVEKEIEQELGRRLEALHEVRRFNQLAGTIAERLCKKSSPKDPDKADQDLVRMWKATGLISVHLDALDLLANPGLVADAKREPVVFYTLVDKVVRLYRILAEKKGVSFGAITGHSTARALVERRTLHIIPSVFIDNAIKYSQEGDSIDVFVSEEWDDSRLMLSVTVESAGPAATKEEEQALFKRRVRGRLAASTAEGTGMGLMLAARVAEQHCGEIRANQRVIGAGRARWSFTFKMAGLLD